MSRTRRRRLIVRGELETTSPVHVGGLGAGQDVDLPLARDGQDRVYVPGTSLAGAFRAWMHANLTDTILVDAMWGPPAATPDGGHASHVLVEDAVVTAAAPEVWDHVRIDRQTGAATQGFKFDRAVLPSGTRIPIELSVDLPVRLPGASRPDRYEDDRRACSALGCLLNALVSEQVPLGAAQTRGLGTVRLDVIKICDEDWATPEGMVQVLTDASPPTTIDELLAADAEVPLERRIGVRERTGIDLAIAWQAVGPVMVQAGQAGLDIDAVPFVSAINSDHVAFTLPGSSIKGAFRSQAERIVRTVLGTRAAEEALLGDSERNDAPLREPLVSAIFGLSRPRKKTSLEGAQAAAVPKGARGALMFGTCVAINGRPDATKWISVLEAKRGPATETDGVTPGAGTSPLADALQCAGLDGGSVDAPSLEQVFHVAIDRWTGGSAEHFLFSTLEPHGVAWKPMHLSLDLERIDEKEREAAVALLLLLVRDFAHNRIPLGFGANRGFGSVELREVKCHVRGDDCPETLRALHELTLDGDLRNLPEATRSALGSVWASWIDSHRTTVEKAAV